MGPQVNALDGIDISRIVRFFILGREVLRCVARLFVERA